MANITSAYALSALPVQSDQNEFMNEWVLNTLLTTAPVRARRSRLADGTSMRDGFYQFVWVFDYLTNGMLAYLRTTFLPSGVDSALVSVMTYTPSDVAIYLNCTLHDPAEGDDMRRVPGGYANVSLRFDTGTVIT